MDIYNAADMSGQLNRSSLDHDTLPQHPTQAAIHKFSFIQQIHSEENTELLNRYNKKLALYRSRTYAVPLIWMHTSNVSTNTVVPLQWQYSPGGIQTNDVTHITDLGNELISLQLIFLTNWKILTLKMSVRFHSGVINLL